MKHDKNVNDICFSFWQTLDSIQLVPPNFWKLDLHDVICFSFMLITTIIVWIAVSYQHSFRTILFYWDGPNYLYAGATLYNIPPNNPWTTFFNYPPSYFACHLPGYPILIRICSYLFFKNYLYGFYLSIIVSGFLLCYSFRRLMIITKCVSNPTFTTILLSFFPTRLIIYHSVGASEPLFMTFVCLSLIFYRTNDYFKMMLSVWLACFTRIEGMSVGFTIGVCYLLRFRIVRAFGMFLTFVAPALLVLMHKYRFNDPLAYIHFNQNSQQLIRWPPFADLLTKQITSDDFYDSSFTCFYIILLVGNLFVFPKSIPIGIFSFCFIIYVSLLFHIDIYRYAIPASIFSFLVGFDELLTSDNGKRALLLFSPFYMIITIFYCSGQIGSNVAWPQFISYMFKSINSL